MLNGISAGHGTGVATLFLSEVSPVESRGRMVSLMHASVGLGDVIGMTLGLNNLLGTADLWGYVFLINGVFALCGFVVTIIAPDSPRHLALTKNDLVGAEKALYFFRGDQDKSKVKQEMDIMQKEAEMAHSEKQMSIVSLLKGASYRSAEYFISYKKSSAKLIIVSDVWYF